MNVSKIVINSKKAFPGSIFIPIRGENFDGHEFIDDAIKNGAVIIVTEKSYQNLNQLKTNYQNVEFIEVDNTITELGNIAKKHLEKLRPKCKIIAITGSVGKTTTKDITASLLQNAGEVVYAKESYNNEIGVPLTIFGANEATDYLVLEVGANHVGEIAYLADICLPDVAVLLKIGVAHLGEFDGVQNIAREKVQIFKNLRLHSGAEDNALVAAIYNRDDSRRDLIRAHIPEGVPIFEFGIADVKNLALDDEGKLNFALRDEILDAENIRTHFAGEHNIYNFLAAIQIATALKIPRDVIISGLQNARPIAQHRMQIRRQENVIIIDDSYNANPDSMRASLQAARKVANANNAQLVAILGDMLELGEATRAQHTEIGNLALQEIGVEKLIGVGEAWANYISSVQNEFANKTETCAQNSSEYKKIIAKTCNRQENVVLLLKGSCAMKLWELGDYIIDYLESGVV
jgi:UDP-N-acetylmuramoyl-tripeptide--D-alanyl-D-alanine ligase